MSSFGDFLLNRDHSAAWSLAFAMTGVRIGERALLVGDDAPLFTQLASKIGLTGHVTVVTDSQPAAARVEAAAAAAGVLVEDIRPAALPDVPVDAGSFDLAVVNAGAGFLALAPDQLSALASHLHRALRTGGRLVVVEGHPPRFLGLVRRQVPGLDAYRARGGSARLLEGAGFRPVRLLADREGQRFTEGLKTTA
jgi:SAM-dependent methyltransferase